MTELSALAGSEGYEACDDKAQRRSPSADGTSLAKKAVEAFLASFIAIQASKTVL